MFNYHRRHCSCAQKWPEAFGCWNIQHARLLFGLCLNVLSKVKWFEDLKHQTSLKRRFQILSVLASKLWPNFTWQGVVFCLILTWDVLWWQWREPGNRGWWVMDTKCTASAGCLCFGADGPPHCSLHVPRSSSAVPVLRATGAGGEHLEFLCSHRRVLWDFFYRVWLSVELFSPPSGLLLGSSASL